MKHVIGLLLLTSLFACDSSKSERKIKKLCVFESQFESGKEINRELVEKKIYDADEKLTSEFNYYEEGKVESHRRYDYDSKGRQIKNSEERNGELNYFYKTIYDKRDSIVKMIIYNSDGNIDFTTNVQYNKAGFNYKDISFNADGTLRFWDEYSFTKNGKISKWLRYNPDSSPQSKVIYEYDKEGREIKNTCSGLLDGTYCSKYNQKGLKIEETAYNTEDKTFLWLKVYSYDESGRITKIVQYNDPKHRPKEPYRIFNYEYTFW
ncbi:MAG: hypothetical protein ACO1N0_10120 [Fluviicola sp.]